LSGEGHPIILPACLMYLDYLISGHDFHFGIVPRIENTSIRVVSIDGFPLEIYPGVLHVLGEIPSQYRWSTRFIFHDAVNVQTMLRGYRRKWQQKVRGFFDQIFHASRVDKNVDRDAVEMVAQTETALAGASSGLVLYGHYTGVVVLMDEDEEQLTQSARQVKRTIDHLGFNGRIETINAAEAWFGFLPGGEINGAGVDRRVVPALRRRNCVRVRARAIRSKRRRGPWAASITTSPGMRTILICASRRWRSSTAPASWDGPRTGWEYCSNFRTSRSTHPTATHCIRRWSACATAAANAR